MGSEDKQDNSSQLGLKLDTYMPPPRSVCLGSRARTYNRPQGSTDPRAGIPRNSLAGIYHTRIISVLTIFVECSNMSYSNHFIAKYFVEYFRHE